MNPAGAKPRIAYFAGPNATIHSIPPLVTSNKARAKYGLAPFADVDEPFHGELAIRGQDEPVIGAKLGDELAGAWQSISGLQAAYLEAAKNPATKRFDDGWRAFLLRHAALGLRHTRRPAAEIAWESIMDPAVRVSPWRLIQRRTISGPENCALRGASRVVSNYSRSGDTRLVVNDNQ